MCSTFKTFSSALALTVCFRWAGCLYISSEWALNAPFRHHPWARLNAVKDERARASPKPHGSYAHGICAGADV